MQTLGQLVGIRRTPDELLRSLASAQIAVRMGRVRSTVSR